MEATDLTSLVEFSTESPTRHTVFESKHLWSQVLCLERNQSFGPVADREADAMVTVVAGEAVVIAGGKRRRLKQWGAALVPAGAQLSVTNASTEPLVILVVTAPPPAPEAAR
ncbi:MAG: cupin domain-containing protein [Actinomycetota bacterium]